MISKLTKIFTLILLFTLVLGNQVGDRVQCFRMQDSVYGHYVNCSSTKPLPLKVETTITLDQDYQFNPYTSYSVYLMDANRNTTFLQCFRGVPSQGFKPKGTNLTFSIQCNSLPRDLKQFDMIAYYILFPDMKWLTYAIPIPGYSTGEDVRKFIEEQGQNIFNSEIKQQVLKDLLIMSQKYQRLPKMIKKLKAIKQRLIQI